MEQNSQKDLTKIIKDNISKNKNILNLSKRKLDNTIFDYLKNFDLRIKE